MKAYTITLFCLLFLSQYSFGQDTLAAAPATEHVHGGHHAQPITEDAEHLLPINFMWVGIGLLLLTLVDMLRAKRKLGDSFSYTTYRKNHVIPFTIAFISSYVMFYFADIFTEGMLDVHVHKGSRYYAWFAMACGFNGHVLVERLGKSFSNYPKN